MFDNLIAAMAARDLTDRDVAEMLRLDVSTLRKKLAGTVSFTLGEIEILLRTFSSSFDELFAEGGTRH